MSAKPVSTWRRGSRPTRTTSHRRMSHCCGAPRARSWPPTARSSGCWSKVSRSRPGTVYPTTDTPEGRLGIIICFDIEFPNGPARRQTLAGSQIILAPSIDFQSIAHLRSASTVFRAVENRVGMVKTDLAWDSVIVAPNGQILAKTPGRDRERWECAPRRRCPLRTRQRIFHPVRRHAV